jgi:hypothetical protein
MQGDSRPVEADMPLIHPYAGAIALTFMLSAGCGSECLKLGGGYGGADLEALQQECEEWSSITTNCDADKFIERDAARCIAYEEGVSSRAKSISLPSLCLCPSAPMRGKTSPPPQPASSGS